MTPPLSPCVLEYGTLFGAPLWNYLRADRRLRNMDTQRILLLLSGGADSAACLQLLLERGFDVTGLCIVGRQGLEIVGAERVAHLHQIPLLKAKVAWFDELTWNPVKLIFRDILMGAIVIYHCHRLGIRTVATGVKPADFADPRLWWLKMFLNLAAQVFRIFRLKIIYPLDTEEQRF